MTALPIQFIMLKTDSKCSQSLVTLLYSQAIQSSTLQSKPHSKYSNCNDDAASVLTRKKIFRRTRDDSGSSERDRRPKTQPSTLQFISNKKLEEILQTQEEKHDSAEKLHDDIINQTSEEHSRESVENLGSRSPVQPHKFTRNQLTIKLGAQSIEKKVIDCRVRPGTPRKDVLLNQTFQLRRIRQLELKVKELQQKLDENYHIQIELESLQQKYKAQVQKTTKQIDKICQLSKQNDKLTEEVQYLKMQLNASRKVTIISTRSDSNQSVLKERENRQLVNEIAKLKDENAKTKEDLSKMRNESARLLKLSRSYQQRIIQLEKFKQSKQEQLNKMRSQRQNALEQTIQTLKQTSQSKELENINQIQQRLHRTTSDLNYYRVSSHCLKKQLQEVKIETASKYNQLKQKYRNLNEKWQQAKKHLPRGRRSYRDTRDDTFQLTPQK